jgi:prevent-host-death family protein
MPPYNHGHEDMTMTTIPAGEFKARCLALMDQVRARGGEIVITKRGIPVARLVPPPAPAADVFGCMVGTASIAGDVESPVLPPSAWKGGR